MLDVLERLERELPILLLDADGWTGLFIDYHPPTVERLWRQWNEYRISLHRIHPCPAGTALFHPHPWPSAMRILAGDYEMAVGYGKGEETPPIAARMIASGDFAYEMTDPDAWHYVRPIGGPSWSIMVTGKPWDRPAPRANKPLSELPAQQREEILEFFRRRYPAS
jgi:hypothetical protein